MGHFGLEKHKQQHPPDNAIPQASFLTAACLREIKFFRCPVSILWDFEAEGVLLPKSFLISELTLNEGVIWPQYQALKPLLLRSVEAQL